MPTTPSMLLDLPTVGSTAGPLWATKVNAAFDAVDAHDHSTGKGTKVTPAGLNITADLAFNSNRATLLSGLSFVSQVAPPVDANSLFVQGGELWFRDGLSNLVQVTLAGKVGAQIVGDYGLAGVDAAVTYNDTSKRYTFTADAASGDPNGLAHLRFRDAEFCGSLRLETSNIIDVNGNYSVGDRDYVLLVSTAAQRTITLPAPTVRRVIVIKDRTGQASTNPILVDATGVIQIDGVGSQTRRLAADWGSWMFVSNGSHWFML